MAPLYVGSLTEQRMNTCPSDTWTIFTKTCVCVYIQTDVCVCVYRKTCVYVYRETHSRSHREVRRFAIFEGPSHPHFAVWVL